MGPCQVSSCPSAAHSLGSPDLRIYKKLCCYYNLKESYCPRGFLIFWYCGNGGVLGFGGGGGGVLVFWEIQDIFYSMASSEMNLYFKHVCIHGTHFQGKRYRGNNLVCEFSVCVTYQLELWPGLHIPCQWYMHACMFMCTCVWAHIFIR